MTVSTRRFLHFLFTSTLTNKSRMTGVPSDEITAVHECQCFITRTAIGTALTVALRPSVRQSVPCLRFSRNRKAIETCVNYAKIALDKSN